MLMNSNDVILSEMRMPTTGASLDEIPVIEVNRENMDRLWPHLILSIRKADLIAIDLELSGLGERAAINAASLEDRYAAMRKAATTRSVLSLGIALFERRETKKEKRVGYKCQVFNVLSLCSEPFMMEPDALRFLADHSFDFNRYVRQGVPYHAAHQSTKSCPLRSLLDELLSPRAPIALHNGLVDLVFLYTHFYTTPPPTLSQFIADLADLFPTGEEQDDEVAPVVDSKFIAEFQERMPASYLEYVFRKSQRDNFLEAKEGRVHVKMSFGGSVMEIVPSSSLERVACALPEGFSDHAVDARRAAERLCAQFANHGFCRTGAACSKAHDVDLALDVEKIKSEKMRRRRKRRLDAQAGLERSEDREDGGSMTSSGDREESTDDPQLKQERQPFSVTGSHRAGVDAFMTGFAVLFHSRMALLKDGTLPVTITNRIPLSGKDRPLHLVPSRLVECSAAHSDRVMLVRAARKKADAAHARV